MLERTLQKRCRIVKLLSYKNPWEDTVKTLLMVVIACALVCAQGCTRNDRDTAGLQREPGIPPTQAASEPTSPAEPAYESDPAANGGLNLRAAAPYAAGGTVVSQNVNPGPFVNAGQSSSGTNGAVPDPNLLTRSADGTMSGPNDLPAATTGWSTAAANYGSAPPPARHNAPAAKTAAPPR